MNPMRLESAEPISWLVRRARKKRSWTQNHLASKANVGVRFIIDLESGKESVRLDKLLAVLGAIGIELHISQPTTSAPEARMDEKDVK
jgi:HTH-type transcriptional regulator/antitoxin HipB